MIYRIACATLASSALQQLDSSINYNLHAVAAAEVVGSVGGANGGAKMGGEEKWQWDVWMKWAEWIGD